MHNKYNNNINRDTDSIDVSEWGNCSITATIF